MGINGGNINFVNFYFLCLTLFTAIATLTQAQEEVFGSLDTSDVTEPTLDEVQLKCYTSGACVQLDKEWLQEQLGVTNKEQLTLRQKCDSSIEDAETHFLVCTEKGKLTSCGTEYTQNRTHISFSNNVNALGPLSPGVDPPVRATIPWTCTYPMELLVGLKLVPRISPVTIFLGNKTGYGEFEASMILYQDDNFQKPFQNVPELHITDRLRVKVQLLRGPAVSKIQVVRCWGAATKELQENEPSLPLIDDYCPSAESAIADVKIRNNGDLHYSLWESNVFRFVSGPHVYVHCNVKVCFAGPRCEKECNGGKKQRRKRRNVDVEPGTGLVSLGPLTASDDIPVVPSETDEQAWHENKTITHPDGHQESTILGMPKNAVFAVIGGLSGICFILIVAVSYGVYRRHRLRKRAESEADWKARITSNSRPSTQFTLSGRPPFEIPLSISNTVAMPEHRKSSEDIGN